MNGPVLGLFCGSLFAATAAATTYTVNVDDTHTFASPLELGSAQVSVDGAAAVAFATLLDADGKFPGSGTFVKTGTGFLGMSNAMTNFTGAIEIQAGALIARATGDLGPGQTSTAPGITVSDGATLVFSPPAKCKFYNALTFAGTGVTLDGKKMGAMCLNSAVAQQDYFFYADWTLTADTTFTTMTNLRQDIGGRTVTLNGHVLTLQPYDTTNGQICFSGTTINPGVGGKFVLKGGCKINLQAGGTWGGDAANELVFDDKSYVGYYNNGVSAPWTLVWNSRDWLQPGGTAKYTPAGWAKTNYMYWTGPVRIAATRLGFSGNADASNPRSYTLHGPVSGPGGIYDNYLWLHLVCPTNSFEGPVTVTDGGKNLPCALCLYNPGALPLNGQTTTITNGPLLMAENGPYHLPKVNYHVRASTNFVISGGLAGGTLAGLVKTGAGRLDLLAPVSVTGKTELAAGTLRLAAGVKAYSAAAGLWDGHAQAIATNVYGETVAPTWSSKWQMCTNWPHAYDEVVLSNTVVESCWELAHSDQSTWKACETVMWGGYLWNRSPTNETWTFAIAFTGFGHFTFDGTRYPSANGNFDNSGSLHKYTVTVTPGPHAIVLKTNPRNYTTPGSAPLGGYKTWKANFGFVIDRYGRATDDAADYVFPANTYTGTPGGDGFWYTRDDRDTSAFTAAELEAVSALAVPAFSNFTGRAGTVLDVNNVNGATYAVNVGEFSGAATVTNGSLRILRKFNLLADENKLQPLAVTDGKLIFGADAVVTVDDPNGFGERGVTHVIARAKDGIEGLPVPDAACTAARCRFAKSADGKELALTVLCKGVTVILR